ncbi:CPA_1a_G0057570.mRNA.1.CDS.1 [Saccharomyces cerevisiae]|nr:CPA_1a_G0057570.mRNA.1.CDS.1 [Saccharomyces cerevisiae]CAI7490402.1 CPA_1a_G0057570.mRNA.1.CDS.1 [Saccharomyces cerevisiae]
MNRSLLLRLSDTGEPITSCSYGKGVLTLPPIPLPKDAPKDQPLYTVKLLVSAGSPVARDGLVWTNCPPDHNTPFKRDKFYKKIIHSSFHEDDCIDLNVYAPGSYCFYLSFRNDNEKLETTRKYYFVALPMLYINDQFLPLNSIALQSVVSKWLGSDWEPILSKIAAKNYNMVHFTPLQERGESNSPYSIYDQLQFDQEHFKSPEDVKNLVEHIHRDLNMLSLTDIVFNHTANNSPWLVEHPEAGYNHITAPHLISAIELDQELLNFSRNLKSWGYPTELKNIEDLFKIMDGIKVHVLGSLKLWEYYAVNVQTALRDIKAHWNDESNESYSFPENIKDISSDFVKLASFVKDNVTEPNFGTLGERNSNRINVPKFIQLLKLINDGGSDDSESSLATAQNVLNEVNLPLYREYDDDVSEILEQLFNRIKYLRLDDGGPKQGPVTVDVPLTEPYFTRFKGKDGTDYALANNGWIWNGNPLVDFASQNSRAYLRREVIVWGDCVKLRYGKSPEDSPYLWERMSKYIEMNAKIFDGFRIDNCHSTPIHVGEYFLDLARKYNPNLYVVAELFSGSETLDCLFVERLGISSLIREAMQAWSEEELSRLVHKHGGRPIGSYKFVPMDDFSYPADINLNEEHCFNDSNDNSIRCVSEIMIPKILSATPPHALFMDCTHDNETPFEKRTVEDTLPNAALVALCSSAIGSVYGYDEIFPHLLNLVTEKRHYDISTPTGSPSIGITKVKATLNSIRTSIGEKAYDIEDSEMHVHHQGQYITFHRMDVKSGKGWYLIARMKFSDNDDPNETLPPVVLNQSTCSLRFSYALERVGDEIPNDDKFIKGIPTKLKELEGFDISYDDSKKISTIKLPNEFPQGSIAIFETQQNGVDESLDHFIRSGALKATSSLTLESINSVLYRSEPEEYDVSAGEGGAYIIPNFGKPVYCGLQGWVSVLRKIVFYNDLAHPLSANLRNGHWALDYTISRLNYYSDEAGINEVQNWLSSRFDRVKKLPSYLVPSYFALIIGILYGCCRLKAIQLMSRNIGKSTLFVQSLSMTSIQMVSRMKSTSILPGENVPSMAAGLPHFSVNYMRCWGRDVFISLRGMLLTTGRFDEAKAHILAFAKTLKHGLIPNLLDAGRNPRYNARDAAWFFLQAVQDYVYIVPDGEKILQEQVTRRFPLDDTYIPVDDPRAFSYSSTLEEIIYEILSRHAKGIKFREANAGPNLDRVMTDKGFNVEIHVDWSTGLIHGGSQYNCGTWMDKMGESEKAGSVGIPGTPRDGAAIEINGLLKSALRFVIELKNKGLFKFSDVETQDGGRIDFTEWNQLLQDNFEKRYYVPEDPSQDADYDVSAKLGVNRRGIYRDLYKSGKPYEDYQLRPNFAIAMTVAPELFVPEHAIKAITIADEVLRGPVGMRTLDPSDYNYRPYYNNGEDSDDFATSKGRNYHQGPEWVWLYGYFLRAFHHFHFKTSPRCQNAAKEKPSSYLYQQLYYRLKGHRKWISESVWAGLTELTNKDGEVCNDSSPTQAWSSACLLDLFYDLWDAYEDDS